MSVVLDGDVGHRVLLYGTDGSSLLQVATNASGQLVVVGAGSGGAVEVIQDTPDDLRVGVYGRYSGSWQRQPMAFGFSADYASRQNEPDGDAGDNVLDDDATPANTLRVITNVHAEDFNNASTRTLIRVVIGGTSRILKVVASTTAKIGFEWTGHVYLTVGDFIRVEFAGVTAGDSLYLDAHGYDMTLNL